MKNKLFLITIIIILGLSNLTVFSEDIYDKTIEFTSLEELSKHLVDDGYLINSYTLNDVPDIRVITETNKELLNTQGFIRDEGYMVEKDNDKYILYLDTKNKPEKIELKPIEAREQKEYHTGCIKTEKINNFNGVRSFVENSIGNQEVLNFYTNSESSFKTDLNILRENLENQEVPEDEIQYILSVNIDEYIKPNVSIDLRRLEEGAIGTSITYPIEGYKIYKEKDYYTVCYLQGGSKDNPDHIINRNNPEEFFNILNSIKDRIDYQFNLKDRNGKYWLRDLHVGTGDIRVSFSDHPHAEISYFFRMQDNIITQPEWMKSQVLEAFSMYDTLVINSRYHEISPEILENPEAIHYIPHTEERYVISIVDDVIPVNSEDPELEPDPIIPEPQPEPEPEPEPNPNPTLKIILIITIIVLIITVAHKLPFIPFIPLFYYTKKVSIYSNLKQEDGTIKRKKVFTEGYEVNGTQLVIDITDTMNMYKEYNYLEIEIPKDIAYSVITKIKEDKKMKEVILRTLIITHKNHKEPIQVVPITENFYDEKKKVYVIRLNV